MQHLPLTPVLTADDTPAPLFFNHLILPLLMPIAIIRSLWRTIGTGPSYLIHLYGGLLAFVGLAIGDLTYNHSWIVAAFAGDTDMATMLVTQAVLGFVFIELGYLFGAFVTMCWGAAPEPWGKSYSRSLRRWWQLTPWHAGVSLLYIGFVSLLEDSGSYGPDMGAFFLIALSSLGCALLLMSTTLRGVAVHEQAEGWPASCRWPLTCEGCGYLLAGLEMKHTCPECGQPVSLSVEGRRGQLANMAPISALMLGSFQPRRAGKLLLAHRPAIGHGTALSRGVLLLLATAPIGIVMMFIAIMAMSEGEINDVDGVVLLGLIIASMFSAATITLATVGLSLLTASIIGTWLAVIGKRRVMHLAGQAVAYTSGVLSLWVLGNWLVLGITAGAMSRWFMSSHPPAWVAMIPLVGLVGNLAFGVTYVVLLIRMVNGARWANV